MLSAPTLRMSFYIRGLDEPVTITYGTKFIQEKIEQSASACTQEYNNQVLFTGILSILFYLHTQTILKFSQNSLK